MYLNESLIIRDIKAKNKVEVLELMSSKLFEQGYVKKSFREAVIEREYSFPTGLPTVGCSVAIPHTDIEHVCKKAICVGILKEPVEFGIMGEYDSVTSVKIVFMLAMNQKDSQLELLQRLMKLLQNALLLQQIAEEESAVKIAELLSENLITERGRIQ